MSSPEKVKYPLNGDNTDDYDSRGQFEILDRNSARPAQESLPFVAELESDNQGLPSTESVKESCQFSYQSSTLISQDPNIDQHNESTELCIYTNHPRSEEAIISPRQLPATAPVSVPGDSNTSGSKTTQENLSPFSEYRNSDFSSPPNSRAIPRIKSFSKKLKETSTPSPEKRSVETRIGSTPTKKLRKKPESHSGKSGIGIESCNSNLSPLAAVKASYESPTNFQVQLFKAAIQKIEETESLNTPSTSNKRNISRKNSDESKNADDSCLSSLMTPSSAVYKSLTNLPTQGNEVDVRNDDEFPNARTCSNSAPESKSQNSAAVGFESSIKVKKSRDPVLPKKTQPSSKGADPASEIQISKPSQSSPLILNPPLPPSCHLFRQRTSIIDLPHGMLEIERSYKTMGNDQNRSGKSTQFSTPVTVSRSQPEKMPVSRSRGMHQRSLSKYSLEGYQSNMLYGGFHKSHSKKSSLSCTSGMRRRSGSDETIISRNLTEFESQQNRHDSLITARPKMSSSSSKSPPEIPNINTRATHIVQTLNQKILQETLQGSKNRSKLNTSSAMSDSPSTTRNDPGIWMPLSRSDSLSRRNPARHPSEEASTPRNRPGVVNDPNDALSQRNNARHPSEEASTPRNPEVVKDPCDVLSRRSRSRQPSGGASSKNRPEVASNVNSPYINVTEGQAFTSSYQSTVTRYSSLAEISTSKNHPELINGKNLEGQPSSSMYQPTVTRNLTSDQAPTSRDRPEVVSNINLSFINEVEGRASTSRFQPLVQSFFPTTKNEPAIREKTNFPVLEGESSTASRQPLCTEDTSSDGQLDTSDDFHPGVARESSHGTLDQHTSLTDKHPEYVIEARKLLQMVLKELMLHKRYDLVWSSFEASFRRISESSPAGLIAALSRYLTNEAYCNNDFLLHLPYKVAELWNRGFYQLDLVVVNALVFTLTARSSRKFTGLIHNHRLFSDLRSSFSRSLDIINVQKIEDESSRNWVKTLREMFHRQMLVVLTAFRLLLMYVGENTSQSDMESLEIHLSDEDKMYLRRNIS